MRLVLHPDAESEIVEAADWYDQKAVGLGDDFLAEVGAALDTVRGRPQMWPIWPGTAHLQPALQRYLLPRFRFYAVGYQVLADEVLVLAVVHARRRPFYWIKRTGG